MTVASMMSWATGQTPSRQRGYSESDLSESGSSWTDDDDDASLLLEMMESGFARESVTQECLRTGTDTTSEASEQREEHQFYVKRFGKDVFEMFSQHNDRFLLTAKRVGDDFTISAYKDTHETATALNLSNRTCAVLKKTKAGKTSSHRLYLTGCDEGCNRRRAHYLLDHDVQYPRNADGMSIDERLLAEIRHSTTYLAEVDDLMLRQIDVVLPALSTTGQIGEPATLCTKLPRYQPKSGCLVQKFHGNRVRASSAKNFMLETSDKRSDVLQFGKDSSKRYILDHSAPLAPLQAFGICLSMCNWLCDY